MQNDSSSTVKKRNAFDLQRYREIKQLREASNNNSTTIKQQLNNNSTTIQQQFKNLNN